MTTARLFGTDGIRGEAGRYPMDVATVFAVGWGVARLVADGSDAPRVVIGRDTRQSGPMFEAALVAGVRAGGGRPELVGVLPTPGIAYYARTVEADAAVVVSASHNPYQDNGVKVFAGSGFKLSDEQEEALEDLVSAAPSDDDTARPTVGGGSVYAEDAAERYVGFLQDAMSEGLDLRGVRLALDTANGATSEIAPAVFGGLGAEVVVVNDRPDGTNINAGCGSEHTEHLQRFVVDNRADLGLAFDGDGDRVMAVDETGRQLTGDQTIVICADMLKREGRLKNDQLVSTVMSNVGLDVACKRMNLKNHAADVGDRHVLEDMVRLGAVLGGESSGHVVFLDYHTTGDGILTGVQLVSAMLKSHRALSALSELMEVFPQTLVNVDVATKPPLDSLPQVVEAIAQVEAELGDQGRVLVRYSGTQDLCRVMVEGPSAESTQDHASRLAAVIRDTIG